MSSQDKCCKIVPYFKILSRKLKFLKRCSLNIFFLGARPCRYGAESGA